MEETTKRGRPTKYDDSFPGKVYEYLEQCKDEWDEFHSTRGEKSDSYTRTLKVRLPSIAGLARFLNVNKSTIYEWKEKYEDFSTAIEQVLIEQEQRLLEGGLSGTYNSTITKLSLANNHGYRDRTDITTNDKDLPTPIMKVSDDDPDVG